MNTDYKEIVERIKVCYLDWYNSDLDEQDDAVKTLYEIGELLEEVM